MAAVLIVDDETNVRRMLAALLEAEGYSTQGAPDGDAAELAIQASEPDVVLLDLALPGRGGIEILESLRTRLPLLPIVMMSGRATLADAVRATKLGAFHFIEKPLSPEAVLLTVASAIELRRARELTQQLTAEHGTQLIGESPAIARMRELIKRVAPTDGRVLITGESGTGKELVALGVHEGSPRAGRAFVRVNSAAIPRELVESEMFGHERGAFTGASGTRRGRFELAHGGTLFLDEVADLDAGAQAKLLRAIELGQIERIGGERPIGVDVRVIAATNRDLTAEIASGRFREDLFYRLNVLPIHLPPLRDRLEDVPALVEHFLARLRVRDGLASPRVGRSAMQRLSQYAWPGNVRELANLCERLAILHPGTDVNAAEVAALLPGAARDARHQDQDGVPLAERLDAYERSLITRSLEAAQGSIADAARALRTDRANLYRRMRRLGIER